jgi:DNA-directed RNA polymerase subunit RPC12/RpoP
MNSVGLIPRDRLRHIPRNERLRHEYCFFLHDECVRALAEYERAKAHLVTVNFASKLTAELFEKIAVTDTVQALRSTGYPRQAKRAILNTITMSMVSDCCHHIYEALRCFEKRKFVVAFNLLRKPLKDNLLYLSWMLGNEEEFYSEFTSGNPELGALRTKILADALSRTQATPFIDPAFLNELIYDRRSEESFEKLFQHAVHLITIERLELRTAPENFNFIFKSPNDNDSYHWLYTRLPYVLFFLSHVILNLFDKMRKMDDPARSSFFVRSVFGLQLACETNVPFVLQELETLVDHYNCNRCKEKLRMTNFNAAKIVLTQSYRCAKCGTKNDLPFAWLFEKQTPAKQ